jgi:hypothetical protein
VRLAGTSVKMSLCGVHWRALSFFEMMGFRRHGDRTLVSGMRGKGGERMHQQIMVWSP